MRQTRSSIMVAVGGCLALALTLPAAPAVAAPVILEKIAKFEWLNHPDAARDPAPYGVRLDRLFANRDTVTGLVDAGSANKLGNHVWTMSAEGDPCAANGTGCIPGAVNQGLANANSASIGVTAVVDGLNDGDATTFAVKIFGTVFGGLTDPNNANQYDVNNTGLWDVEFTYTENVVFDFDGNGNPFIAVTAQDIANSGIIKPLFDLGITSENEATANNDADAANDLVIDLRDHQGTGSATDTSGNAVPLSFFQGHDAHR